VCVTGAGGSIGVVALCGEANEKPNMAAVIGVVEPSLGVFGVGLEVVVLTPCCSLCGVPVAG
jgi:hypothetical protein